LNPDQIYPLLPEDPSDDFDPDLMDPIGDPAELQEHVKEILVRAATQAKMNGDSPGSIPGDIQIFLDNLLSPKLPWKVILSRFIQNMAKNDYSFKKLNRRFFPAHYLPGLYSEKLTEIAIAVDASGSVSDDDFKQMVSETHTILKQLNPDKITLVQFDAVIKSVNTVRSIRELMEVKFHGRGGTKIEPVIQWAKDNKPKLLLVFSDGDFYFRVQENKIQTLWLIHDNPDFTAPFGKVIHYEM
jgi:predicted metal-dependent peptidase